MAQQLWELKPGEPPRYLDGGIWLEQGWKSNTLEFARRKIQCRRSWRGIILEDVMNMGFDGVNLCFGRISKAVFGRA
jgi:hypothetical protein